MPCWKDTPFWVYHPSWNARKVKVYQGSWSKGTLANRQAYVGNWTLKKGDLTAFGYSHTKSATERHEALDKAVQKYGRASTIRKLNAIATYSKRTGPSRALTYRTDMHYVQKKFA